MFGGDTASESVVSVAAVSVVAAAVECTKVLSEVVPAAAVEDSWPLETVLESTAVSVVSVSAGGVVRTAAAVVSSEVAAEESALEVAASVSVAEAVDCVGVLTGVVTSETVENSWRMVITLESTVISVVSILACGVVPSPDAADVSGEAAVLTEYSAVSVTPEVDSSVAMSAVVPSAAVEYTWLVVTVAESSSVSVVSVVG